MTFNQVNSGFVFYGLLGWPYVLFSWTRLGRDFEIAPTVWVLALFPVVFILVEGIDGKIV